MFTIRAAPSPTTVLSAPLTMIDVADGGGGGAGGGAAITTSTMKVAEPLNMLLDPIARIRTE
jgi:hypothetical protein